jgi:hypothetical protein
MRKVLQYETLSFSGGVCHWFNRRTRGKKPTVRDDDDKLPDSYVQETSNQTQPTIKEGHTFQSLSKKLSA